MTSDDFDRQVRVRVYANTIDRGAPPSIAEVAAAMDCDRAEVAESFRRLAGAHVLVLQPDNGEILMAPPFSAVPTPFVVETERYATYANWIWDALGIAAILRSDVRIVTSCGDCGTAAEVSVDGDEVRGEGLIHFAIPARDWWNDIVFTWKTMLLFRSEEHIDRWCAAWRLPRGAILTLETGWRLAQRWLGPDRRDPAWRRRTVEEAEALFSELELTSSFWSLR